MIDALTPQRTVAPPPVDLQATRYVRSYLIMRIFVGAVGVALPVVLVLLDYVAFGGPFLRGSLSAYYYSGARDVFVGALCAIAVFLVTYKVAERNLDNTLSFLAGLGAVVVAFFPTGLPAGVGETALQDLLGVARVEWVHYGAASVFIASLAVITYFFGVREGSREERPGRRSPQFWRRYHWTCAAAIVVAILWIVVTEVAGGPDKSLLIGEVASVWAFAASWFMKGLELDTLRGTRGAPDPEVAAEAA